MSGEKRASKVTLATLIAACVTFVAGIILGAAWESREGSYRTVDECVLENYPGGGAMEIMALERLCGKVVRAR
ncbi:hypothetical protein [Thioalkalivibrio sp. ARh3]|uniref:hypothetical protein n=1 Tax=Thioalkalivibrio sp. ARh3 TaxID=1158148 RepID=UPI000375879B|nr:hypothetical protein [Thioalkalivibrio sp. ARh3]